ncbi:MAG: L-seryl-tRNA(Sec) selenium transferase, partial [Anaerolineae bacterium]|nr:L-seryl-tRNA(Sec) selenium transferase [Anaerolineae bacterium]
GESTVGGGSLPGETLPTSLLALPSLPADRMANALRNGDTPVIARITQDALVLDPRTVATAEEQTLLRQVIWAAGTLDV